MKKVEVQVFCGLKNLFCQPGMEKYNEKRAITVHKYSKMSVSFSKEKKTVQ